MLEKLPNHIIYYITNFLCIIDSRKIKNILRTETYNNPNCNIYTFMHQTGIDCACTNPNGNTGLSPWIQFG